MIQTYVLPAGQSTMDVTAPEGATRVRIFNEQGFLLRDGPIMDLMFQWDRAPDYDVEFRLVWSFDGEGVWDAGRDGVAGGVVGQGPSRREAVRAAREAIREARTRGQAQEQGAQGQSDEAHGQGNQGQGRGRH